MYTLPSWYRPLRVLQLYRQNCEKYIYTSGRTLYANIKTTLFKKARDGYLKFYDDQEKGNVERE